jgi:hypothetical protein
MSITNEGQDNITVNIMVGANNLEEALTQIESMDIQIDKHKNGSFPVNIIAFTDKFLQLRK